MPDHSGVPDFAPRQVRDALVEHGWGCIPIIAHDSHHASPGKAPTIREWQRFAAYGAPLPTQNERADWDRATRSRGAGTGIPCGNVIGIDIDVSDPALVDEITRVAFDKLGVTPFIRQGRAPRVLMVYRAAEPIPKQALKANDGLGDGLDVIGIGSQFVAFGVHPKTRQPYAWLGAESPLKATPEAASTIGGASVAAFLDGVRALLPLTKTGGRARGPGGTSAEIVRDAEAFVTDGREAYLARVVWRACAARRLAGAPLVEAEIAKAAWAEFERTARVEVDGRRRTRDECVEKVRAALRKIHTKVLALPEPPAGPVEATYPNTAVPLAEAETIVLGEIAAVVREANAFRNRKTLYDLRPIGQRGLPPTPFGVAFRIEAGGGKTEAAVRAIVAAVGLSVVYAVPTIELADQVAERLRERGVDARVWRGREKDDPDAPGLRMCRDLQAVADARRAGVYSIAGAVCSSKPRGGKARRCRQFDVCGHVRQRSTAATVWVVTHGMLFSDRPAAIPSADLLVIDEGFAGKAIPDKPRELSLETIERAGLPSDFAAARALQGARQSLVEALRGSGLGSMTREALLEAGVSAEAAQEAKAHEWKRFVDPAIVPDQAPTDRDGRVEAVAAINAEVKALAGLWNEISDFLTAEVPESGRVSVIEDKSGARSVRRRSLKVVHESWRASTLVLDATAPPASVLSIVLGMPVEMRASIRVTWHEAAHVRQVIGAPVSSNQLGGNGQGGGDRFLDELARYVAWRAAAVFPAMVGVVIQKDLVDRIKARPLPENVDVRHFGALAGLDHWKTYGGIITIGRTAPPPGSMEADAGVLTGEPIPPASEPFAIGGILKRDDSVVAVSAVRLADTIAEALRWQICEGNLIQAIGRIRPLRLHGRECFFVDVIADVPLPIVAKEVVRWEDVKAPAFAAMAAAGVILASPIDAEDVFGLSRKAARSLVEGVTVALTSKEKDILLDVGAIVSASETRPRRVVFKRRGRQYQASEAFLLPNAPRDRRALRIGILLAFGSMDRFEIEGEPSRLTLAEHVRAFVRAPIDVRGPLVRALATAAGRQERLVAAMTAAIEANPAPGGSDPCTE